jgi:hypothetical protein
MRAAKILDVHISLMDAVGTDGLQLYLAEMADRQLMLDQFRNAVGVTMRGEGVAEKIYYQVLEGVTHDVRTSLVDTIHDHAAAITGKVGDYPPPTDYGVAILEKPLTLTLNGVKEPLLAHILTWGQTRFVFDNGADDVFGWLFTFWNDTTRQFDRVTTAIVASGYETTLRAVNGLVPTLMHQSAPNLNMDDLRPRGQITPLALVHAMWDLMNRVPEPEKPEHVDRASVKRAARVGLRADVRSAPLHSPPAPSATSAGTGAERAPLDHHVYVREHYRWQAYGPGRKLRKRIKIAEYDYGPEDPPGYVPPAKVYVSK